MGRVGNVSHMKELKVIICADQIYVKIDKNSWKMELAKYAVSTSFWDMI